MLKRRACSMQKDQQMCQVTDYGSSVLAQVHKKCSFFSLPGLFVGLNPKSLSDYYDYSASSPTSPLDCWGFSNSIRSPRSPRDKIWDCDKVGLGIIDILDDGRKVSLGKVLESPDVKNIVFGPHLRIRFPKLGNDFQSFDSIDEGEKHLVGKSFGSLNGILLNSPKLDAHYRSCEAPRSLPKNFAFPHTHSKSPLRNRSSSVVFEIGNTLNDPKSSNKPRACSLNSTQLHQENSKLDNFSSNIPSSTSEVELSEDYTCITVHGTNPKMIHIYADCFLECKSINSCHGSPSSRKGQPDLTPTLVNKNLVTLDSHPSDDF